MSLDRVLGIIGVIAFPAGTGVGFAMDTKTNGELRFAQGCFVVSAVVMVVSVVMWGFTSEAPAVKRALFVFFISGLAGFALVESLRWSEHRHATEEVKGATKSLEASEPPKRPLTARPTAPEPKPKHSPAATHAVESSRPAEKGQAKAQSTPDNSKPDDLHLDDESYMAGWRRHHDPTNLTIKDLWYTDFSDVKSSRYLALGLPDGHRFDFGQQLVTDMNAQAKFLALYVPHAETGDPVTMCRSLADHIGELVVQSIDTTMRSPGESDSSNTADAKFAGKVYLYVEDDLTTDQQSDLKKQYKSKGYTLIVRGIDYLAYRKQEFLIQQLRQATPQP